MNHTSILNDNTLNAYYFVLMSFFKRNHIFLRNCFIYFISKCSNKDSSREKKTEAA